MIIDKFKGEYKFLSNFYPSNITIDGITYPTAEHAYQAAKTNDIHEKLFIRDLPTPGKAKRAGRRLTLRKDWEEVKVDVMYNIVSAKFNDSISSSRLGDLLLTTLGNNIVEGNSWGDTFWGVNEDGDGLNILGEILMRVRWVLSLARCGISTQNINST